MLGPNLRACCPPDLDLSPRRKTCRVLSQIIRKHGPSAQKPGRHQGKHDDSPVWQRRRDRGKRISNNSIQRRQTTPRFAILYVGEAPKNVATSTGEAGYNYLRSWWWQRRCSAWCWGGGCLLTGARHTAARIPSSFLLLLPRLNVPLMNPAHDAGKTHPHLWIISAPLAPHARSSFSEPNVVMGGVSASELIDS